jgi:hypothetical protein
LHEEQTFRERKKSETHVYKRRISGENMHKKSLLGHVPVSHQGPSTWVPPNYVGKSVRTEPPVTLGRAERNGGSPGCCLQPVSWFGIKNSSLHNDHDSSGITKREKERERDGAVRHSHITCNAKCALGYSSLLGSCECQEDCERNAPWSRLLVSCIFKRASQMYQSHNVVIKSWVDVCPACAIEVSAPSPIRLHHLIFVADYFSITTRLLVSLEASFG